MRVDRLITQGETVVALETDTGEEIAVAGHLFLLANGGVQDLVRHWVELPTWNAAFQVLVSRPLGDNPVRHLVGHAHRILSLKRESGERLMISGGHQGRWDAARGTGETLAEAVAANVADAVTVYPALEGLEIERADAGHLEIRPPSTAFPIVRSGAWPRQRLHGQRLVRPRLGHRARRRAAHHGLGTRRPTPAAPRALRRESLRRRLTGAASRPQASAPASPCRRAGRPDAPRQTTSPFSMIT